MVLNAEQKCYLWLSAAEITPDHVQKLIECYGSPVDVWEAFGSANGPVFQKYAQETLKRLHSRDAIDDLQERLIRKNVHLLFRQDPDYPHLLDSIQDPPYLLYYAGRLTCLKMPLIALVGTRRASEYGCQITHMLARGICEAGVGVVSGLARGIDYAAHQGALSADGYTVGVLGSGINKPYPPEHTPLLRQIAGGKGLIISEYPLDAEPLPFHFPHRNRIISGLSHGVVFVEGRIKSGGMHTVQAALMQGREVFAVPGRIGTNGSEGPHAILREGARIITSASELLDDLGLLSTQTDAQIMKRVNLSPLQQKIVQSLQIEPLFVTELAEKLKPTPMNDIITELGALEILGVISREAGNRFFLPVYSR